MALRIFHNASFTLPHFLFLLKILIPPAETDKRDICEIFMNFTQDLPSEVSFGS